MDHLQSDDRLMASAALGSREAFDAIVRRHQDWVQRFAARMLGGDTSEGSVIAVEAFVRLWKHRGAVIGSPRAWLARTAYRLCVDSLRAQPPNAVASSEVGCAMEVEQAALGRALRDAVVALPEGQRAVLILSVYEQMSYEEISEALSIPLGTVGSRKNLAIASLRRSLAGWED